MNPVVFIPEPIAASGIDLLKGQCQIVARTDDGAHPRCDPAGVNRKMLPKPWLFWSARIAGVTGDTISVSGGLAGVSSNDRLRSLFYETGDTRRSRGCSESAPMTSNVAATSPPSSFFPPARPLPRAARRESALKPVVFIPEPIAASGIDLLKDQCEIVAPWRDGDSVSDDALRSLFYDMVDCEAATARGIPVLFTPGANSRSVAEHTIALIMALARQIGPAWQAVLDGKFDQRTSFEGIELAGKTLGLIGLGQVGRRVAEIAAQGLKMEVCGYDPLLEKDGYEGSGSIEDSLEAVLRRADFLSLHVPLSPRTKHLITEKHLGQLKPGCRIINTSRGGVVDEAALVRALQTGEVSGAALDVFETEPLSADHPLCSAPNTLLTPHIAGATREALDNMARDAAQGVLAVLNGRRPRHAVNPEVLR